MSALITEHQRLALERLLEIALGGDTGQCAKVANFLLSWWNAAELGGFDLTDAWAVDAEIAADFVTVFSFVARNPVYPDALGYKDAFVRLIHAWRPAAIAASA